MTTVPAREKVDYWLAEKSGAALRCLTSMAQLLRRETLSREDILDLRDDLYGSLAYTATIVSASVNESGVPFGGDVAAAILREGKPALEEFLYHRGLISETTAMADVRETCEILHPLLSLLDGPRGENRTLICSILAGYRGRSPIVSSIGDLTEEVTQGQISWLAYCDRCRRLITAHKCSKLEESGEDEGPSSG